MSSASMAVLGFTLPPDSGEKLSLGKYQILKNNKYWCKIIPIKYSMSLLKGKVGENKQLNEFFMKSKISIKNSENWISFAPDIEGFIKF